jgi:molybdenum cofactor cytidylyltransferase
LKLAAIVLAAGASRRFGSSKQLHIFEGKPLVRRAAETALAVAETTVVLGANAERIVPVLEGLPINIVIAGDWEEGMAASLRAGIHAVASAEAALILLCDQPRVTAEHLQALIEAFEPGDIMASDYGDVLGPPCLFDRAYFPQLLALSGDSGARKLLRRETCRSIPFHEGRFDIDDATSLNDP